jgi:hypothetical protein
VTGGGIQRLRHNFDVHINALTGLPARDGTWLDRHALI